MNRPYLAVVVVPVLLVCWVGAGHAQTSDPSEQKSRVEEREEEMFGSPEEEPPPEADDSDEDDSEDEEATSQESTDEPKSAEERREADMFGEEPTESEASESEPTEPDTVEPQTDESSLAERFEERLEEEDDPLQLGGTYFGRLNYTILEEGNADEFPVSQPNIADIYFDARPTDRLRFYTTGRLFFDPTIEEGDTGQFGAERDQLSVALDQLWLKFDIARTVYVTVGRQQTRWGVGRFWFPNDFLFAQKRDPLAIFDERTGVDIIKVHVPVEKLGWNFYVVGQVDGADSFQEFGGAARAEFLVGQTEFAFSSSYRGDQPLMLGFDVSTGVGLFDLRGAFSAMYGNEDTFYRGELDLDTLSNPNPMEWVVPEEFQRDDEWLFRALGGAELSLGVFDDDLFLIGGEYFYNDLGYDDPEIYPWLLLNNAFRPFYVGRHYAALYASLPSPGEWDDMSFTVSTIANLSDRSFLSRFDYRLTMLTRLQFYTYASLFYGQRGEFNLRIEVPPINVPGAPEEAQEGVTVPATRAQVGLGLQLDF